MSTQVENTAPEVQTELSQLERDAHWFRQVEQYCGVARLAFNNAVADATLIQDETLKEDAYTTIVETLEYLARGGEFKGDTHGLDS